MDSAANYTFDGLSGLSVVEALLREAKSGFSMLDVGAAKADFVYEVEALARSQGVTEIYLRGTTAGYERNARNQQDEVNDCCCYGEEEQRAAAGAVRIYHAFPLEDLLLCDQADFIAEGRRFNLIVASWTMLHLADPLGTLTQVTICPAC